MSEAKDQKKFVKELQRRGWRQEYGGKNIKMHHPLGGFITLPMSPKSHRNIHEIRKAAEALDRENAEKQRLHIVGLNAGTITPQPPVVRPPVLGRDAHTRWKGEAAKCVEPPPFNPVFKDAIDLPYTTPHPALRTPVEITPPTPQTVTKEPPMSTHQLPANTDKSKSDPYLDLLVEQSEYMRSIISGLAAINKRLDLLCAPIEAKREETAYAKAKKICDEELKDLKVNEPKVLTSETEEECVTLGRVVYSWAKQNDREFRTQRAAGFGLVVVRVK